MNILLRILLVGIVLFTSTPSFAASNAKELISQYMGCWQKKNWVCMDGLTSEISRHRYISHFETMKDYYSKRQLKSYSVQPLAPDFMKISALVNYKGKVMAINFRFQLIEENGVWTLRPDYVDYKPGDYSYFKPQWRP